MTRAWILCAFLVVIATTATSAMSIDELSLLEILAPEDYPILVLPPLPYAYDALEPFIETEIMQIHHDKHHQAYVNNYNKALGELVPALVTGNVNQVALLQSALSFIYAPNKFIEVRLFDAARDWHSKCTANVPLSMDGGLHLDTVKEYLSIDGVCRVTYPQLSSGAPD